METSVCLLDDSEGYNTFCDHEILTHCQREATGVHATEVMWQWRRGLRQRGFYHSPCLQPLPIGKEFSWSPPRADADTTQSHSVNGRAGVRRLASLHAEALLLTFCGLERGLCDALDRGDPTTQLVTNKSSLLQRGAGRPGIRVLIY